MLVAGVDVGSATSKAVIRLDGETLGSVIIPTGHHVAKTAEEVLRILLEKTGSDHPKPDYVISTGYGRRSVPYADKTVTEIICHAKGAKHLLPETRTIIDIGGQDSKVIWIDEHGNVTNFLMNDKCAAGTGRFLEVMARVLNLDVDELGAISLSSRKPCQISSTCTVFAESEMVSLRAEGENREDLVAGIIAAVSKRVVLMGSSAGFQKTVAFTGGVAKNSGVKAALEGLIDVEVSVPYAPQLAGALGAALIAEYEIKNSVTTCLP